MKREGRTLRDISGHLKQTYNVNISTSTVGHIVNAKVYVF